MNRIIPYIAVLVLLFSALQYMTSTSVSLTQLNLTIPMRNSQQHVIVSSNTISRGGNEVPLNAANAQPPSSINKGGGNGMEEDWLHKILGAILGILSALSMFIKFLVDLTIIGIPQPSINETSVSENQIAVNPLYMLVVLLLSITLTVVLLLYLSRGSIRIGKHVNLLSTKHRIRLESSRGISYSLDFSDITSAITSSFQHLYHLAREELGLDEARTPREIALEFEGIDLGDEAWLIVSAFEELKYGGRVPGWLTLKDLREAVGIIDGKIMKWSNH